MDLNQKIIAALLAGFFIIALLRVFSAPLKLAVKLLVKFWRSRRVEVFCPKLWPPRKPPTVWSKQTGRRLFRRTQPLPPETSEVPGALAGAETAPAEAPPPKTDRQSFYDLNFN